MKRNSNRWSMVFLAVLACVVWAQAPAALAARNKRFNEVCSGTVSTADFSFDGSEQAGQYTAECITNIDGPGLKSGLSQNVATATGSCTAPDGTVGTQYNLLQRYAVTTSTKNGAQIFSTSDSGVECISNTTNVFGKTESWTITGGTGKFKNVTGSGTEVITGAILAKPASPGFGKFGVEQTNSTGTISW